MSTFRQLWPADEAAKSDNFQDLVDTDLVDTDLVDTDLVDADLPRLYAPPADPWLRLNFVASVDGAASVDGVSEPLSSPADKAVFAVLRDHCDALIVGAQTFRREGYRLPIAGPARQARRAALGRAAQPRLVIVSRSLDLDLSDSVVGGGDAVGGGPVGSGRDASAAGPEATPLVITHRGSDPGRRAALAQWAEIVCVDGKFGENKLDLAAAVRLLHGRGYTQLLCEGGPRLFGDLAAAGLVDELCLTISPQLALGGGPRITTYDAAAEQTRPVPLRLTQLLHADGALLSRYAVVR